MTHRPNTVLGAVIVAHGSTATATETCHTLARSFIPCVLVSTSPEPLVADPDVCPTIRLPNVGYGVGANVGVADLVRWKPDAAWILILNDDVVMSPTDVSRVIEGLAAQSPETAVAAIATTADGSYEGRSWALFPSPATLLVTLMIGERRAAKLFVSKRYPIGAAFAIRRTDFMEVGGFSPEYFLYWEETDLFARLRDSGRGVSGHIDSGAHHRGSVSTSRSPRAAARLRGQSLRTYQIRNRLSALSIAIWLLIQVRNLVRFGICGRSAKAAASAFAIQGYLRSLMQPRYEAAAGLGGCARERRLAENVDAGFGS